MKPPVTSFAPFWAVFPPPPPTPQALTLPIEPDALNPDVHRVVAAVTVDGGRFADIHDLRITTAASPATEYGLRRRRAVTELRRLGRRFTEARSVDRNGLRVASFAPEAVVGPGDRYVTIARTDLASAILSTLDGRVETVFSDTVAAIDDDGAAVHVRFESGTQRDFDLVVGADGLHSRVRELVFGAQERFERYLGIVVAVFDVAGYRPRDELTAIMHAEVGFQLLRVSLRDDVTMFCISLRDDGSAPLDSPREQQALLHRRLTRAGWETPAVLDAMGCARTFYFDRVSQIRMPSWARGRVAP